MAVWSLCVRFYTTHAAGKKLVSRTSGKSELGSIVPSTVFQCFASKPFIFQQRVSDFSISCARKAIAHGLNSCLVKVIFLDFERITSLRGISVFESHDSAVRVEFVRSTSLTGYTPEFISKFASHTRSYTVPRRTPEVKWTNNESQ
jgi:hypothetical protein